MTNEPLKNGVRVKWGESKPRINMSSRTLEERQSKKNLSTPTFRRLTDPSSPHDRTICSKRKFLFRDLRGFNICAIFGA